MPKSHHPLNVLGEPRAFFGRRSGKRLHKGQERLFHDQLPALEIVLGDGPLDPPSLFPDLSRVELEIGCGGGEHLSRLALSHPQTGFIGSEVFSGGIAKLVEAVGLEGLRNVRLFTDDALKLLVKLPDASLDAAYLLYPDPWPKTRHHKRRFVSPVTLGELARVLKRGSILRFATDIDDYANWTLAMVVREPRFRFAPSRPGIWHEPWPGWEPTRYERKARIEGRAQSFYFEFIRH
jgi:tRNA (guanine-N7-)-methyltransferase